jgi:hypothetical protein
MLQSMFKATREAETIGYISCNLTNYGYNEERGFTTNIIVGNMRNSLGSKPPANKTAFNSMLKGSNAITRLKANAKMNGGVASDADKLRFKDDMRDARNTLKNGDSSFKEGMRVSRQLDHYQTQFNKKYDN